MEFHVLHGTRGLCYETRSFRLRGYHPLWRRFSTRLQLKTRFVTHRRFGTPASQAPQPRTRQRAPAYSAYGLGYCPFAHHYSGNRSYFLFLRLLRWFSSPRLPPAPIDSVRDIHRWMGCPIRKSPDQRVFAAPRSLSQLATSFVGSQCLGIRRVPLVS